LSRSFHATHAARSRLEREDFSDAAVKERRIGRIRAELRQKRKTKRSARHVRRRAGHAPTPVAAIPVRATDRSPFVHHPADEEDVRELLRRLPRGVTDGLAGVALRLGLAASEELAAEDGYEPERDPFTGRASSPLHPGVWGGRLLGRYRPWAAEIELFAFVFDSARPDADLWMPLLRAEALATLAHEVAHHHDHGCRVARGRWIAGHEEAVERHAEAMQHRWTHEIVLPYLRERYPDAVARLERWVERHGGITLPLEEMVDDPRATGRGGLLHATQALFSMRQAFTWLAEGVARGEPAWRTKLSFAAGLRINDRFHDALRVIEGVLRERPDQREALVQRAELLMYLGRHDQALALAAGLVTGDAACREAWRVAMRSAMALRRWRAALHAADELVRIAEVEDQAVTLALLDRAEVRLAAGDVAGARADLARAEAQGWPGTSLFRRIRRRIAAAESGHEEADRRGRRVCRGWWW